MCFDVAYFQTKIALRRASLVEGRFSILSFTYFSFASFAFATSKSFSAALAFALRFTLSSFCSMVVEKESSSSFSFATKASFPVRLTRGSPFVASFRRVSVRNVFVYTILCRAWRKAWSRCPRLKNKCLMLRTCCPILRFLFLVEVSPFFVIFYFN